MSQEAAQGFIDALHELEQSGDPAALVARYADDCEVGNITATSSFHGHDGARRFWSEHRQLFDELQSKFRNVIVDDQRAALEWTIEGRAADGGDLAFSGVTLLEFQGELVKRSMAYFDPRQLGRQLS